MKFIYSAFAACALFCTSPQLLAGSDAPAPQATATGNVRVGIETAKLYPVAFLQALQTHAGKPLLIISSADVDAIIPPNLDKATQLAAFTNYLLAQGVDQESIDELKRIKPGNTRSPLSAFYEAFTTGAIAARDVSFGKTEGGIIQVPGLTINEPIQAVSSIQTNYRSSIPVEEWKRLRAAHEASHIKRDAGKMSEAYADTGSINFVKQYPEFFPYLSQHQEDLELIRILRAMSSVSGVGTTSLHPYNRSAFCKPLNDPCSEEQFQEVNDSYLAARGATAALMIKRGIIADIPRPSNAEALFILAHYILSVGVGKPLNLAADKSGVLVAYFQRRGITNLDNPDIKQNMEYMFDGEGMDYAKGKRLKTKPTLSAKQWDKVLAAARAERRQETLTEELETRLAIAANANIVKACLQPDGKCNNPDQMIEIIRNRPSFHDKVIACMKEIVTRSPISQISLPERAKLYSKRVVEGARLFGRPAATCTKN